MDIKDRLKINDLPPVPGIYQFYDKTGKLLYIGKAKNLCSRIKSYFLKTQDLPETRSPAIYQMVKLIDRVKIFQTDSEIEAVFLEAQLINKLKPKYNVRQKDDKSFYVIEISKEKIPRIELWRARNVNLKDRRFKYFGPYSSSEILKRALRLLRKIFPFADCSKTKFQKQQKIKKACLYGDIGLCLKPCENKMAVADCKKQAGYLTDFLSGKKKKAILSLNREMKVLSHMKKYEKAARVRDQINALEHLHRYSVGIKESFEDFSEFGIFPRIEAYDISNILGDFAVGAMAVISLGKINKDEYRKFKIKSISRRIGANDIAMMNEIIKRRFKNIWPEPNLIVIDGGAVHLKAAQKITDDFNKNIPILSIAKGAKRNKDEFHYSSTDLAKIFQKNPALKKLALLARDEAHRFSQNYYRNLHRKSLKSK